MRTLLVVEDHLDTNDTMSELLNLAGYSCLCARNGERALSLMASQEALIVLDLKLPDMTGGEFLVRKAAIAAVANIPVIVITGLSPAPKIDDAAAQAIRHR